MRNFKLRSELGDRIQLLDTLCNCWTHSVTAGFSM
jgi:hypothetical protein